MKERINGEKTADMGKEIHMKEINGYAVEMRAWDDRYGINLQAADRSLEKISGIIAVSDPNDDINNITLVFNTLNNAKIGRNILMADGIRCDTDEIQKCTGPVKGTFTA